MEGGSSRSGRRRVGTRQAATLWIPIAITVEDSRAHELAVADVAAPLGDSGGVRAGVKHRRHAVRDKPRRVVASDAGEPDAVVEEPGDGEFAVAIDCELGGRQGGASRANCRHARTSNDEVASWEPRARG